jgi:succinate dehydrogenase / fumarate reductase cytochrome b subunit
MSGMLSFSIFRKFAMALSGLFLVFFLGQHFVINFTSVISPEMFNDLSHFMGTNPLVQFVMQPILIAGVLFHFVMGFVLEIKNRNAREVKYVRYSGSANATWMSRNMIVSGVVVLLFLGLHFYDFWVPEMQFKYVDFMPEDPNRYYDELAHKFVDPVRTVIYILSFAFLSLHLMHGFSSAFQSVGVNNKYTVTIKKLGVLFSVIIPMGFVFIALFHYFKAL